MTGYDKLVAALRERARREDEYYEHGGDVINDAADAIEALQAEVKILKVSGREAYFEGLAAGAKPKRGEIADDDNGRLKAKLRFYRTAIKWLWQHRTEPNNRHKWRRMMREVRG